MMSLVSLVKVLLTKLFANSAVETIAIPSIWTSLEPDLGVICGCLLTFPLLFRQWSDLYKSRCGGSHSKLVNSNHSRFLPSYRANKDSSRSELGNETTVDLRCQPDIEMETQVCTASVYRKGIMPTDMDGIGVHKDVSLSYQHV